MTQGIGCSFAVVSVGGRGNAVLISAGHDVWLVSGAQSPPVVAARSSERT